MTRIPFLGDIFGRPGRHIVRDLLPSLVGREEIDLVLANGENASGGLGLNAEEAGELLGLGLAALTGGLDCLAPMREAFLRRRNLVMEIISAWPDVPCPVPGGSFYVFPDMRAHYNSAMPDSTAMCKFLLDKAGVALVPGEAFGDDNCVRLSYATDDATLQKALDLMARALFKK